MTAGTLEKVYRLDDPRLSATMGAVLAYYAYRAYYPDGRCAWPAVKTVAAACFCDEKTVRRALAGLCDMGYMRLSPDQTWNVRDAASGELKRKGYRSKVYDVLVENFAVMADEGPSERAAEHAEDAGEKAENQTGQNVHPRKTGGLEGGHPVPPDRSECPPTNNRPTNNPSLPTGELPASGKRPTTGGKNNATGTTPAMPDEVRAVTEHLAAVREKLALTTKTPTGRDANAVSKLLDRIASRLGCDRMTAADTVNAVLDWMPANDWWLKRVDSARRLAADWDRLRNDWTIAQRAKQRGLDDAARDADSAVQRHRRPVVPPTPCPPVYRPEPHVHTFACEHVLAAMRPHEDAYDHEGSMRHGRPSEWQKACQMLADEMNRREGIEAVA
mgnify:CR=1 FL=1